MFRQSLTSRVPEPVLSDCGEYRQRALSKVKYRACAILHGGYQQGRPDWAKSLRGFSPSRRRNQKCMLACLCRFEHVNLMRVWPPVFSSNHARKFSGRPKKSERFVKTVSGIDTGWSSREISARGYSVSGSAKTDKIRLQTPPQTGQKPALSFPPTRKTAFLEMSSCAAPASKVDHAHWVFRSAKRDFVRLEYDQAVS